MKQLFAGLLLLAGLLLTTSAFAGDLIVSRGVLEDKTGILVIADVAGREFKPTGPTLSKGYTKSVHWLRLQVRKPVGGSQVVLFIRQPLLNEIRLYEVDGGDPLKWKSRVTGNYYPYSERERGKKTLGFVVNITSPEATYYLRLKTNSLTNISVEALEPSDAESKDDFLDQLEVFFVTAMSLFLLWALHSYLLDRRKIVGLFALHQVNYLLFGISVTGYLTPLIPVGFPRLTELSTVIPYCTVNFTTLLFCRELFKPYQPPRLLMRGLNLFLLAFPLQLVLIAFGNIHLAVIINLVLIRISWGYFVVMTFTLRREQSPGRRMLQIFFVSLMLVLTLFWIISNSTSGTTSNLGRYILITTGLIIGGIFAMILNARSRRLLLDAQQSAMKLQAKSEFLALVSHEIRTPLNALVGFTSLAQTTTDPAKLGKYLSILKQSSLSLMELVNDILDMSKIEAGRIELETIPFNLRQLLARIADQYLPLAEHKKLSFQLDVASDVPTWILGDPVRLRQILINLLGNAVKFTEKGRVTFSITISGRGDDNNMTQVCFAVRDTGIGIPESSQTLLFQPFSQLDPSITRKFGGTGLGLAIVNNLVKIMGGTISIESRNSAGSCFSVVLPFQETEALPEESSAPLLPLTSAAVLVVEDNRFNRYLLEEILTAWGQQVVLAEDGLQALQFMEQQHFDLVLLDIRMPGIDGIEVTRRIRSRELERAETCIPIIAITADADANTREECLRVGINTVLTKPVDPVQLARAIAEFFGNILPESSETELLLNMQTYKGLGNDPERIRQYREILQNDIDDELRRLQVAIDCNDRTEIGLSAHTLKGLCGQMENREPSELAAWLQNNAASATPEQLRQVVDQMGIICYGRPPKESLEEN